jgi:hypothetical protein
LQMKLVQHYAEYNLKLANIENKEPFLQWDWIITIGENHIMANENIMQFLSKQYEGIKMIVDEMR